MQAYYVEGVFITRQGVKKARKTGSVPLSALEPYAKTILANSPQEAAQIATSELNGGEWSDGPHVSRTTEEQRMRSMGAPEFPGLQAPPKTRQSKK